MLSRLSAASVARSAFGYHVLRHFPTRKVLTGLLVALVWRAVLGVAADLVVEEAQDGLVEWVDEWSGGDGNG